MVKRYDIYLKVSINTYPSKSPPAAILYDDSFVMDHKYKSLLQNIQTRHVITAIAKDGKREREEQIEKLRNLDINNFFILGTLQSIRMVLESVKPAYFERNFAWHAITQNEGEISSQRDNATIMFMKPMAYTQYRDRLGLLRTTYNLNEEPQLSSAFYFDLALRSFLTIKWVGCIFTIYINYFYLQRNVTIGRLAKGYGVSEL